MSFQTTVDFFVRQSIAAAQSFERVLFLERSEPALTNTEPDGLDSDFLGWLRLGSFSSFDAASKAAIIPKQATDQFNFRIRFPVAEFRLRTITCLLKTTDAASP